MSQRVSDESTLHGHHTTEAMSRIDRTNEKYKARNQCRSRKSSAMRIIMPKLRFALEMMLPIMDCKCSNDARSQKRPRAFLEEEAALESSIQSKRSRTKIYSGAKGRQPSVPKLFTLATRSLQENVDQIGVLGGRIPFDLLRPVLEKATPNQLTKLEQLNPYLLEDTYVLWEQHCRREFRNQQRKEEEYHQAVHSAKSPVRKTQLLYMDSTVKPPRNVISKQIKYGTDRVAVVSPAARVPALQSTSTNVVKVGDSRLKAAVVGAKAKVPVQGKPKKAPLMAKLLTSIKGLKGGSRR
ncbi:transcription elongation factor B polypeptide 3-like [Sabethes cyaneus]|uniref:transcription elongation factor B polypeptide 3-like n=1 Tax=Sabethes cyaneus TaxID=53552 RepID=UPI00237DABEF|nr:transcription elongation factor B polypeptide 3-like [Sabethes cyaneus]